MPSKKTKLLSEPELGEFGSQRDLAADLLQSVREMKAGKGNVVYSPALESREITGLSQSRFAALLGVSIRTLQRWEQGRKQPSGAARTLLAIARMNPKALLAVAAEYSPLRSNTSLEPTLAKPPEPRFRQEPPVRASTAQIKR